MALAEEKTNRITTQTDWAGYLKFLDAVGDGPLRVTYCKGSLEIMSPSQEHENIKEILSFVLEQLLICADRDFYPAGSMTFKREDLERGVEPDLCYWLQVYPSDRATTAPPDLVVE